MLSRKNSHRLPVATPPPPLYPSPPANIGPDRGNLLKSRDRGNDWFTTCLREVDSYDFFFVSHVRSLITWNFPINFFVSKCKYICICEVKIMYFCFRFTVKGFSRKFILFVYLNYIYIWTNKNIYVFTQYGFWKMLSHIWML